MKYILPALLLTGALSAQAAQTTNIGGGCSPVATALTSVSKAVIGKDLVVNYAFPEPVGAAAWMALGLSDPNAMLRPGCVIHSSGEVFFFIGTGGTFKQPIPNDVSMIGCKVYLQAVWSAPTFSVALTNAYKLLIGNK